jgi:hypothetical protein
MCFGVSPDPAPPEPKPQWWVNNPPKLKEPKLQLNEDATEEADKKRRKVGTQKLQIPLTPKGTKSGLGIPSR